MIDYSDEEAVNFAMGQINGAWMLGPLDREQLAKYIHPEIVMVFPGFTGRMQGIEAFLAGFEDFLSQAKLHEYQGSDNEIDIVDHTAVVTFTYEMVYERENEKYRATGRDLWVFQKMEWEWQAVWRTMLELEETPVE